MFRRGWSLCFQLCSSGYANNSQLVLITVFCKIEFKSIRCVTPVAELAHDGNFFPWTTWTVFNLRVSLA